MRDLLIITPTRGRPGSAQRLAFAVLATATAATDLILAIDDDDPSYDDLAAGERLMLIRGPRMTCPAWTNKVAGFMGDQYRALASLGDDHVPLTPGWDTLMLDAIAGMGGTGIAYGDDGLQHENLPTAPVISSDIPAVLGWMMLPACWHLFCDNVWLDLGRAAGCLRYLPQVAIRHLHYTSGLSPLDATYAEAAPSWAPDEAAYHAWRRDEMAADVEKIRKLLREPDRRV